MAFDFPLDKLAQDLYDAVAWHLLFLLPQWCSYFAPFWWDNMAYQNMDPI
jgi:hypothetical protein